MLEILRAAIRAGGPLTLAAFMELALYHPERGYYARTAERSGRAGDFFTSVDVGPLFGELLAVQFEEMRHILHAAT
nr:SAM-dependent methyltransferase [Acidobacteriota bacterium]